MDAIAFPLVRLHPEPQGNRHEQPCAECLEPIWVSRLGQADLEAGERGVCAFCYERLVDTSADETGDEKREAVAAEAGKHDGWDSWDT